MSQYWLIYSETGALLKLVESELERDSMIIRNEVAEWLEVPAGIPTYGVAASGGPGNWTLIADSSKVGPAWTSLREKRNRVISGTDWTQLSDSPLSSASKALWATYRQALRDLPTNTEDPANPSWPEAPVS